ncbi:hypothetical protein R6Q57_014293 [Mikania cordata]
MGFRGEDECGLSAAPMTISGAAWMDHLALLHKGGGLLRAGGPVAGVRGPCFWLVGAAPNSELTFGGDPAGYLLGTSVREYQFCFIPLLNAKMKLDLLEVQPQELEFLFELKKQSSCSVQLINKTNDHVAFKIKTTTPKKYCVRPNTGVIDPNSLCDFTVTMQAPKVAPLDMICRDKFLVQSTIVPEGTKEEDVTSNMFAKEDGENVDEKRLRVIFVSPPDSSELLPINEPSTPVHDNGSRELKDDIVQKDSSRVQRTSGKIISFNFWQADEGIEVSKGDGEHAEATRKEETFKRNGTVKRIEEPLKRSQEYVKRNEELMQVNDTEELILTKGVEEMKLKVKELESKLTEAKATILHLTEEIRSATHEKHILQGDVDLLRSKRNMDQTGFPLLFVFMVSLMVVRTLGFGLVCKLRGRERVGGVVGEVDSEDAKMMMWR